MKISESYAQAWGDWRWEVPERFNMGVSVCDAQNPNATALIVPQPDGRQRDYSFGDLKQLSSRLANLMVGHGLAFGDRVAVLLPQMPETLVAHIAAYRAGFVAMPMAQLFGPVPGGLGIAVVFVGALLAATTGIVGATVIAMGLISLPVMMRAKYSNSLATGTIAASGTLGQIIPPSIVLIILADQLGSAVDQASTARKALFKSSTGELSMPSSFDVASTSAGEMFLGAFVPGLVLVGLYMAYILVFAMIKPKSAPAVHFDGKYDVTFARQALLTLVPPLALIFMVLGSIITGIATVNQAGAIGAAGAVVMAGYRLHQGPRHIYTPAVIGILSLLAITLLMATFDLNLKSLKSSTDVFGATLAIIAVIGLAVSLFWSGWRAWKIEGALDGVMIETAKTSSLVFIILLGAAMLTAAFRAFGGEDLVRDFLNSLPGGFWSKFIIVMAVIFILGFFLDFIEIAVVVVPIVAPILLADPSANVTAVWLGVMIGLNIQTSFLTPPFGFALFYLRGVAPAIVKTVSIYKGVIAFIILQLVALGIVGFFPSLVNYLPNRMSLTSESAPPPRNPRLQYCVEQYVAEQFASDGALIGAAITQVASLDLGNLSKSLASEVKGSFAEAEKSMKLLDLVFEKEKIARAAEADYRPLHTEVRQLHRQIRVVDAEAPLDAEPVAVGRAVRAGDVADAVVADVIDDLAADPAERADAVHGLVGLLDPDTGVIDHAGGQERARRTCLDAFAAGHAAGLAHGVVEIEDDLRFRTSCSHADDVVGLHLAARPHTQIAMDAGVKIDRHRGMAEVGNRRTTSREAGNIDSHAVRPAPELGGRGVGFILDRLVGKKQFQHHVARRFGTIGVGLDHHAR